MEPVWWAVIASLVSAGVTALGWCITYGSQKKLLEQQATMQKEAQAREAVLRQFLSEHDTRFSFLHTRRGKVMEDLYGHFAWALFWLQASIISRGRLTGGDSPQEQQKKAFAKLQAAVRCFLEKRLYLDLTLCEDTEKLIRRFEEAFSNLGLASQYASYFIGQDPVAWDPSWATARVKLLDAMADIAHKEIPIIQRRMEEQMRRILNPTDQLPR